MKTARKIGPINKRRGVDRRWVLLLALGTAVILIFVGGCRLWASYQFHLARQSLEQQRLSQSQVHLQRCLQWWAHRGDVWLLAGQTYRRQNDLVNADHCFRVAESLGPEALETELARERKWARAQQGDLAALPSDWRALIQHDSESARLLLEVAVQGHLNRYRYRDAAELVEGWLKKKPEEALGLYFQGQIREQIGPRAEAPDSYRRSLDIDPDNDEARLRLVRLYLDFAQPAEARAVLQPLLDRRGQESAIRHLQALTLYGVGERSQAEAVVNQLLAASAGDSQALSLAARLAIDAEQFDRAESLLTEAIRHQPANHEAQFLLFQVLTRRGDEARANDIRERMNQIEKDTRRLQTIFTDELAQKPNDPALFLEIGSILLRSGETRKGLQWLNDALKLEPKNRAVHHLLAEHYRKAGDDRTAALHARQAESPQ